MHLPSFFPATKALTGYLIVFNTVGELPTGEQQTSLWTLTAYQTDAPSALQTAWPYIPLTAAVNTSATHPQEEECSVVSVLPTDLQAPPKPLLTTLMEGGEDLHLPRNGQR